jgi:hypothetical protein
MFLQNIEKYQIYIIAVIFLFVISMVLSTVEILTHMKVNGDKIHLFKKSLANSFLLSFTFVILYITNYFLDVLKLYSNNFKNILESGLSHGKIKLGKWIKLIVGLKSGKMDKTDIDTIDAFLIETDRKINIKNKKRGRKDEKNDFLW